jgi:Rieske 2Fe-2S family protein
MNQIFRSDIADLLARRQKGRPLEAPFYTSAEIFDLDLRLIFARHWIFVAVEPDVPEPGDFITVAIGAASVVILRDDAMEIRAFHNVCRHRGARIVNEPKGFVGNLLCPYHNWTYDLTGNLIHTGSMAPDFDPRCHGLKPVHLRRMAGLIFICLADAPPEDFDDMARQVGPYIAPHRLGELKIAAQSEIIEEGNWKLTIENNRECFHCANHPELLQSLFHFFGYSADDVTDEDRAQYELFTRTQAEFEAIWETNGLPWRPIEQLEGRPTAFRVERLAMAEAGESFTLDTRAACRKPVAPFSTMRLGTQHVHMQPNSWFHFLSDHIVTFSVFPLGVDRTLVCTRWLVHKDAAEGVDYDVDTLTKVWQATNMQDGNFVAWAQAGIGDPAYEPGPLSPTEYMVENFDSWYCERLSAELQRPSAG